MGNVGGDFIRWLPTKVLEDSKVEAQAFLGVRQVYHSDNFGMQRLSFGYPIVLIQDTLFHRLFFLPDDLYLLLGFQLRNKFLK